MLPHIGIHDFKWIPGDSIDLAKLARMQINFPKPDKLPPVAWFMNGIEYHESVRYYREWSDWDIQRYLGSTGIRPFGRLKIWVNWFHHMLPSFIKKASTSDTLSWDIIEYFYAIYPHEIHEEYLGFHHDIFHTLMKIPMQERFWKDGDLKIPDWAESLDDYKPEWYEDVDNPLYEGLAFCIKYLPERNIPYWIESVAKIEGKIWKLQVKYWVEKFRQSPAHYYIPEERAKLFFNDLQEYPGYEDI